MKRSQIEQEVQENIFPNIYKRVGTEYFWKFKLGICTSMTYWDTVSVKT